MTQTNEGTERRAHLHAMWESVTGAWGEHATFVDTLAHDVTARMLALSAPQPGDRVLELACGAGGVGLAAAELVGPDGEVVLSDVAAGNVATARSRADALGLSNVTTRILDLEQIDEADASYDVVLSRDGFQFALEPARAAHEIRRVLRPGGRVALAVWGPRAQNPWLGVVFDAVSAELGAPVPPPGVPGPFSAADAARLQSLLSDADFVEVTVAEEPVPRRFASVDDWWAMTTALAGPLAMMLASLPDENATRLRDAARARVAAFQTEAGLEFPGLALVASACVATR